MFHHFKIMKKLFTFILSLIFFISDHSYADRIKDMVSLAGVRSNQLVGYGLVIGLAKTGDGSVNLTKQSIAAMISQFGVIANTADIDATNAANVICIRVKKIEKINKKFMSWILLTPKFQKIINSLFNSYFEIT